MEHVRWGEAAVVALREAGAGAPFVSDRSRPVYPLSRHQGFSLLPPGAVPPAARAQNQNTRADAEESEHAEEQPFPWLAA